MAKQDADEDAIPYYLPKPYLIVTMNVNTTGDKKTKETSKTNEDEKTVEKTTETMTEKVTEASETVTVASPQYAYQIVYLPDLRYKYGLRFSRGSGTYEASFKLEDGWRFTGLTSKGDAKTAESIQAVASLVKELGAAGATLMANRFSLPSPRTDANHPAAIWVYEIDDTMNLRLVGGWHPTCEKGLRPSAFPETKSELP
jgi:hypothetical protein